MPSPPLSPWLPVLIAALTTFGPFSVDTYLPSLPAIGQEFGVTRAEVQQTLTAYLLPYAVMALFHGMLSDSFGRRPVILAGVALYTLASLGCALAPNLTALLAFRALQGFSGGVGMVVGRTVIRDCYHGHEAQRLLSKVYMIFAVAPAVAPVIGGWLHTWFGWRSVFVFLALFGAALWVAAIRFLPETHPPHARQLFALWPVLANYGRILANGRFVLLAAAAAASFAGFFLYIVSAPAFIYDHLRLNEHQFAWLFLSGVIGMIAGSYLSSRLAGRRSPQFAIGLGYAIMFAAAAYNVAFHAWFAPALPWSVAQQLVYALGISLAMPAITLLLLDLFPHNRGLASSLQGFAHSLGSTLVAGVASPLLSASASTLSAGMLGFLAGGFTLWLAYAALVRHEPVRAER